MQLKSLGEFGLIKHLTKNIPVYDRTVVLGIGDDAAAFKVSEDNFVLITCDMLIEGHHFILNKITPWQLGYKSLAVNLSDIAAMGGVPRHSVISIGWPDYVDLAYTENFYDGFKELAGQFGVNILGGDTVKAPQLVINVTVIGEIDRYPITRKGALPGDVIAVTGRLGASGAGLDLIRSEDALAILPGDVYRNLTNAHLIPVPRMLEARVLAASGSVTAMIDISDGLASEINHIAAESNVGAIIYADLLPVDGDTKLAGEKLNKDYRQWALFGGEDYELLFTLPAAKVSSIRDALGDQGVGFTIIGDVCPKKTGVLLASKDGKTPLHGHGYNHFKMD